MAVLERPTHGDQQGRTWGRRWLLTVALVVGAMVAATVPAAAAGGPPAVTVFIADEAEGWSLNVIGAGFSGGTEVAISFDGELVGTANVAGAGATEGTFVAVLPLPASTPLGVHAVRIEGTAPGGPVLFTPNVTISIPPAVPGDVVAVASNSSAAVTWSAPTSSGDTPIVSYFVEAVAGDGSDNGYCQWSAGPLTCRVLGLTNGTSYTVTVRASNSGGPGDASPPTAAITPHPFADVPPGAPFFDDINWMAGQGITTGYPDGTFHPASPVPRQAMAAFLYRVGHPVSGHAPCTVVAFNDVPLTSPFCWEIAWMATEGIALGYPDGGFHPTAVVSRQAMAAFLYRFSGKPLGNQPPCAAAPFPDVPTGAPFCGEIAWMKDSGITTGYADGNFHPTDDIARQAMAAFLHRLSLLPAS